MKTLKVIILSMMMVSIGMMTATAQERVEVPGDNFSLEGALQLFKTSSTPEEFERLLNSPDSKINNLDLNADGMVDYIRVIDKTEGNIHIFILQAMLSERESQDVAVIELEKLENGKAVLQIVGDPDVYGIETIIEPTSEVSIYAGAMTNRQVVNVWTWPVVQYVYDPYYVLWVSPWHWFYRPVWWISWSPIVYYDYYTYWRPYRYYYSYCYSHRIVYGPRIYSPYRTYSRSYWNHHHTTVVTYRDKYRDGRDREGRDRYDRERHERDRGQGRHYSDNRGNGNGYGRGDRDDRDRNDKGNGYGNDRGNSDNSGDRGRGNGYGRNDKDKSNNGQGRQMRNQYTDQRNDRDRYDAGVGGRDDNNSRTGQRNSYQRSNTQVLKPVENRSNNSNNGRSQQYRSNQNSKPTIQQGQRQVQRPSVSPRNSQPSQQRSVERGNSGRSQPSVQRGNSGNSQRSNKSVSSPSRGKSDSSPSKPSKGSSGGKRGRGNN